MLHLDQLCRPRADNAIEVKEVHCVDTLCLARGVPADDHRGPLAPRGAFARNVARWRSMPVHGVKVEGAVFRPDPESILDDQSRVVRAQDDVASV
eukprot:COSAG05_NODE_9562_length_616_cov_0.733075_1_plen_94_part_01